VKPASAVTLRSVTAAEVPAVHAMIESAYRGDTARAGWTHEADLVQGPRTSIAMLEAIVRDRDELLLIAEDKAGPVGCVQLGRRRDGIAYLGLLTVDPQRQASGLGRSILAAAEEEAVQRFDARTMELLVVSRRPELIAYYERRGYVRTGEYRPFPITTDPPLEFVVLSKPLRQPA
jgi:predicted N-acetyltransferase YhbS